MHTMLLPSSVQNFLTTYRLRHSCPSSTSWPVDGLRTAGIHGPQCRFQFSTGPTYVHPPIPFMSNRRKWYLLYQQIMFHHLYVTEPCTPWCVVPCITCRVLPYIMCHVLMSIPCRVVQCILYCILCCVVPSAKLTLSPTLGSQWPLPDYNKSGNYRLEHGQKLVSLSIS